MADNSITGNPEISWFGVKLAFAVAGFWGGVLSLSFVKNLTPKAGVMAVLTGVGSASYITPVLSQYFGLGGNGFYENGVAFVVGLTAMNLIPGVIKLSEMWRHNPLMFIKGNRDGSGHEQ